MNSYPVPCPLHITWVCGRCDHKMRNRNKLFHGHKCSRCHTYVGHPEPVYHRLEWRRHECNDTYLELVERGEA